MQDKDTANSTFSQVFQPLLSPKIWSEIRQAIPLLDKGSKKLTSQQLVLLIAHGVLEESKGLREISTNLQSDALSHAVGLDSISSSQISRRLQSLPTEVSEQLLTGLIRGVRISQGLNSARERFGNLYMIDSSTITQCLTRYRWAELTQTKSGVKLHLRLRFDRLDSAPDKALITPAKTADKKKLDELIVEDVDAINVFDRGYIDYKKFDEYCELGIRFVSRIKDNATLEFIGERPVTEEGPIEDDVDVILGTGTRKMHHKLRVITVYDFTGKPVSIITNIFDKTAEEIGAIYRYRWQIELFFKWLKQHGQVKHFFGQSQAAVMTQLLIALTLYCAILLLKKETRSCCPLLSLQRLIKACLFETYPAFLHKLLRKHGRHSRGRRRLEHDKVYEFTLKQVDDGETELLSDLTYDPVIL